MVGTLYSHFFIGVQVEYNSNSIVRNPSEAIRISSKRPFGFSDTSDYSFRTYNLPRVTKTAGLKRILALTVLVWLVGTGR